MKAKTKRAARLPKARVMWANAGGVPVQSFRVFDDDFPSALIPCRTLKQARAWVRLARMPEIGKADQVFNVLFRHDSTKRLGYYDKMDFALDVLRALGLGEGGGKP